MTNRMLLSAAAALLFGAMAFAPEPAAAHWAGAPASATHASQAELSDVVNVHRRGRRHYYGYYGWGAPFAYPYYPYYHRPYAGRRCGWVWSPRHYRHVWRCWR